MKNTNLELPEKSATHAPESHHGSHLATEALSLFGANSTRSDHASVNVNRAVSQFLDLGDAVMLYGRGALGPSHHADKDNHRRHDRRDHSRPDHEKRDHDKHDHENKKQKPDTKEQKQEVTKKDAGTEGSTTPKDNAEPKTSAGMHPDRLEEIGKEHPEEVTRFHETAKNAEHQKLSDWADKNLQEPERSKFNQDMNDFEARAQKDGLAVADVTRTYQDIGRLTSATGETPLTTLERNRLAQQVMHQAAVPTSIDQGQHGTCNVTTVETRTYTRTPALAARLVADVALNGEYRANDGTLVKQSPKAHHESLQWPTPDGARTHASEIFQVTAINIHYAKENAKNGTNIRYEQVEPNPGDRGDGGERLMDYSVPGGREVQNSRGPIRSPYLDDGALTEISHAISARTENDVCLVSDKYRCGDNDVTMIHSKEELQAKLKYLKEHNQLPAIIRVNTTAEPFYTDSGHGSAGGSGGAHVVTITDYDEKTGAVTLDNQWGKSNDHGKDKPVHVHDLYTAMQGNQGIEEQLQRDVAWNRAHNTVDPAKEMQLLRLQKLNGHISTADYTKELNKTIEGTHRNWQSGNVSEAQKESERRQLSALIHNGIPAKDQIQLIRKEHQLGMISYEDYRTQLTYAGVQNEKDFNSSSKTKPSWYDFVSKDPVKEHNQGNDQLNAALADLTPQDQQWVRNNIQIMSR